ncbi:thiolase family protein [Mycobacterium sp. 236(2023)]|uniref:thiolase family protein n=1 Tax=Mycobacterium sp. 236(2023) TaxID=3038163 RepID=UPI0024157E8B|nr:thiolase family protein [Mycobacterium sp. 236(2023)]MDG4668092.1 thiolase family protein [Mycobacterium sp. 236(2023)]
MATHRFEHDSILSGVGQSDVGRRLGRSSLDLTVEAALAAIADSGLTRDDIDGISTYPGGDPVSTHGYGGPPSFEVQEALRLQLNWFQGAAELPGQLGAVIAAMTAVSAGLARHVLVYRTVVESSAQGLGGRGAVFDADGHATPLAGWLTPFGAPSAVNWLALLATHHFAEFGTTREQLGQIALTCRRNAGLNPAAVYRDPIAMADYLQARMISTPLCLLDCDVPVDGSTAFIVSHADYAPDAAAPPVYVEAVGTAMNQRFTWDQQHDLSAMAATGVSEHLWSRTALRPADVDTAQLYDGFSILALVWLEAMGFCPRGASGEFVEGGRRIALDGELPINTGGGQLSGGRLHGFGLIHEAALQLRRQAGHRQLPKAEVAAVGNGGGPIAGAMLLTSARY